jgi:hypothetical protein
VSEIPFVNALGDEIERAAARRRGRIRRRITLGALGFAIAATGVAAASGVFGSPEQLASTGIACYDTQSLDHGATVLSAGDQTPIETCRRALKTDRPLVACAGEGVQVVPGGPGTCRKLGLRPLPLQYTAARQRVNALAHKIDRLESSVDCWGPDDLSRRVQTILERTPGWRGWTTKVTGGIDEGACGTVSQFNGDGSRGVDGAFDATHRLVLVTTTQSRSLTDLLYTPHGVGTRLMDATGERCYAVGALEDLARSELAGRSLTFDVSTPTDGQILDGSRGERFSEGCAVIVGYSPAHDGSTISVEVWAER